MYERYNLNHDWFFDVEQYNLLRYLNHNLIPFRFYKGMLRCISNAFVIFAISNFFVESHNN